MTLKILKEVRDIRRFDRILGVLFEEGFDALIAKANLGRKVPLRKRVQSKKKKRTHEQKLRHTLERLGPTFVKLGQMLSIRPDLLPPSYIKELEKLQDDAPELPFKEVKTIIETELDQPLSQTFKSFDKKPLAAASISQVHKAVLKSGEQVAVKVQRPGIQQQMQADMDIMHAFARLIEHHIAALKPFEPVQIVEEFSYWTLRELDFKREAQNAKTFKRNFEKYDFIDIPKVFDTYSTGKLLVTEFVEGTQLHDVKKLKKQKINLHKVISNGIHASLIQVFEHGFFHGDPHPGNILVRKDGSIFLLDFGIVGRFDEQLKNQCIRLMIGVVTNDAETLVDVLKEMGLDPGSNTSLLKSDIEEIIEPLQYSSINELHLSSVIERITTTAVKYHIKIPRGIALFAKALFTLEGIALEYDPKMNLVEEVRPFLIKVMRNQYSPKKQAKKLLKSAFQYQKIMDEFPRRLTGILDTLEKGKIKVDIEDTDINKLSHEIDKSSNRIAYGLVIAGLLIAAAFMSLVDRGPFVYGIPVLSFITFCVAALFSLMLFTSILREK